MKIKSSPELLQFYKDWYRWATKWWVTNLYFSQAAGLCYNLELWSRHNKSSLSMEMSNQFYKAGLNSCFPFGEINYIEYRFSQHTSPERLAWVKQRIEDMEG